MRPNLGVLQIDLIVSDSEHSTVLYTSISLDFDLSSWGIPLMDAEHVYPEYLVPSDDDIPVEDQSYATDASPTTLSPGDTPIPFPSKAEVARLLSLPTPPPSPLTPLSLPLLQIPSPPLPLPSPPTHTSPTYVEAPLGYKATKIRLRVVSPLPSPTPQPPLLLPSTARRVDIPEADILPRMRLLLTALTPRRNVAAIEVVNLRISYHADVRIWESEKFYTRHQDAQEDRTALRDEALDRSEAHNKALEARISVLETQAYRHEWQRQDADDHATGAMMRIHVLKARACIDTLEDIGRVADALAERDANISRNGDDIHDSGSDGRKRMPVASE
uniref:Uncharacterized protein n=1 Tax=Tanacetum cinerariifolium TaxID=118510 RepID=A0A6L2M4J4_TANCI|nr:hypothetical protein [Tanacetum cinerariifolium]